MGDAAQSERHAATSVTFEGRERRYLWTVATMAVSLPLLVILCATLWRGPYPIREALGQFTDIAQRPATGFLMPTLSYYRPLFHLTLWAVWHGSDSIDSALAAIKLFHVVPLSLLVLLFIWHLRPKTLLDAAVAALGVAVLVGAPGLLGNLEPPLSYTIVGMPAALGVWMLLEREPRVWHGPAIVALTLIAIGFKEQGLVIVPLVVVAWWMGAPGASRFSAIVVAVIAVAYVAFRLATRGGESWPPFEQDVGFGFIGYSSVEAEARFGAFPLWIFLYSCASTVANVLFSEPTDGLFRFVFAFLQGRTQSWHVVYLGSSLMLTALIVWWGIGTLKGRTDRGWSPEARLFVALALALAASGLLSFDYSRERLGGMAVPFYALAAFFAIRAAVARVSHRSAYATAIAAVGLMLLSAAWQCRAVYTIEFTRQRTVNSHREWIVDLGRRRIQFASSPVARHVLEAMVEQGSNPDGVVHRTRYPRWLLRTLGED
jgi:hypothetical protein